MFKMSNVLYVEDENEVKSIVTNIIGDLFKNFYTASNGKEGLIFF